jgi:predicted site-specific integrase-resolvase
MAHEQESGTGEWVSRKELARELGFAYQTLANWAHKGVGPPFAKITEGRAGRVRYNREDVDAWLSRKMVEAA